MQTFSNMKHWATILISAGFVLFPSCSGNQSGDIESKLTDSSLQSDTGFIQKARYTFYNLYSPIEMSKLFENQKAEFKPELSNPVTKSDYYVTNFQIASNLGVYGVDFNYLRIFNQEQLSLGYLETIQKLSSSLGIPTDIVTITTANLERSLENKDSLMAIVSEIFAKTDMYLKENERLNMAVYILLGTWTESMYISLHIFDTPKYEVMKIVSEQRFSLQSLIHLLSSNMKDKAAQEYVDLLKSLHSSLQLFNPVSPSNADSILHQMDPTLSVQGKQEKQILEIRKQIAIIRSRITR